MYRLREYFEHTIQMAMNTSQAIFNAANGINDIRKTSLAVIHSPTKEQLARVNKTEKGVLQWIENTNRTLHRRNNIMLK